MGYSIEKYKYGLIVSYNGYVLFSDFECVMDEMHKFLDDSFYKYGIIDFSGTKNIVISEYEAKILGAMDMASSQNWVKDILFGMVVPKDLPGDVHFLLSVYVQTLSKSTSWDVRVFESKHMSKSWLASEGVEFKACV